MKSKLVVGNWKMNGGLARNQALLADLVAQMPAGVDSAVCVPFPYLAQAQGLLADSPIGLGAQDVSAQEQGAHTGEVCASMLREFGCRYVIVGHSERRAQQGECDALVARKAAAALAGDLIPIVCVGETLSERDAGQVEQVLIRQLDALEVSLNPSLLGQIVLAYEPVWAIGTGRAATPHQVQAVLALVRNWLAARVSAPATVRVLYGGSVKPDGAAELFALPDCDGGLIGGASLHADQFIAICQAAASAACRA